MAGREPSIPRRRVLGAAAALPVLAIAPSVIATPSLTKAKQPSDRPTSDRTPFNRRLAHYRGLVARAREAAETGWFRAANDRHYRDLAEIEARLGGRQEAEGSVERSPWERLDDAEDAYWHRCTAPMQRAAIALALTPAPDLAALRAKIAVMREQVLAEEDGCDCLSVLEEDVERLKLGA